MADKWGRPINDKHYGKHPKDVADGEQDVANPDHRDPKNESAAK